VQGNCRSVVIQDRHPLAIFSHKSHICGAATALGRADDLVVEHRHVRHLQVASGVVCFPNFCPCLLFGLRMGIKISQFFFWSDDTDSTKCRYLLLQIIWMM
jgi:hypothetical protein